MKRFLILSTLLLVTACSDEGPLFPLDPNRRFDQVAHDFVAALEEGDAEAIEALFDPNPDYFTFYFSPWDEFNHELPTWYLKRGEFMQALGNIFSGQPLLNEDGSTGPAITRLEVTRMVLDIPWEPPPRDHWNTWRIHMNIWEATYHFEMIVHREGLPPLTVGNKLMFMVRPLCPSVEDCGEFALMGFDDFTGNFDPAATMTLGTLLLDGFVNTAPDPLVELRQLYPGSSQVAVDACNILDEGYSMSRGEVRFRRVPDTEWTPWSEDCEVTAVFGSFGEQRVEVEARDRWGAVGGRTVSIDLLPPTSPR